MVNAFQDQLLKAGLVTKDKLNKSNKNKHKQTKQQPKNATTEAEAIRQQAKQAAQEKTERDRELNRQRLEAENKKAIHAQIRQLVEMNRVSTNDGDVVYNFQDKNKVKHIYITDAQRRQIASGRLAIVWLDEVYMLVPKMVAEKIMQRDADVVILLNDLSVSDGAGDDEDDAYADYKVPDDLMW